MKCLNDDGKGHSLATIDVEYEWKPPRCATCMLFDHTDDKCSKLPKVVESKKVDSDGFTEVKKRKHKVKQPKQVEGVRLSKPKPNFYYRRVEKGATSQNNKTDDKPLSVGKHATDFTADKKKVDEVKMSNSFSVLEEDDADDSDWNESDKNNDTPSCINGSDSDDDDVEELIMEEQPGKRVNVIETEMKGASTPVTDGAHD
ncbi:hypothetical protein Tco_0814274 [Tanacetum coccineum]